MNSEPGISCASKSSVNRAALCPNGDSSPDLFSEHLNAVRVSLYVPGAGVLDLIGANL